MVISAEKLEKTREKLAPVLLHSPWMPHKIKSSRL